MKTSYILIAVAIIVLGAWWYYSPTVPMDTDIIDQQQNGQRQEAAAVAAVVAQAAQEMAVGGEEVQVVSVVEREWSDACLDLAEGEEMCALVITLGYEVTVTVADEEMVYRTNGNGSVVRKEQ